jgi:capsular polysaccharide biosynthesis protein
MTSESAGGRKKGELAAQLRVKKVRDAVYLPGRFCLYDLRGCRIEETVHLRDGHEVRAAPTETEIPRELHRIDRPIVFSGHLPKHFGHFLLESLGRLWIYLERDVEGVAFAHTRPYFHLHERELLQAALRGSAAPLLELDRPTVLSEAIIPEQALVLGGMIHPVMAAVYDRIREALVGLDVVPDARPVFLSRSRLPRGRRRTLGETALEQRLADEGVRILHPQELPLADQIAAVAAASTVIGLYGTALHLTAFRPSVGRTITIGPRSEVVIQRQIEELRGSAYEHHWGLLPVHPRIPGLFGGRELAIGPYRNALIPWRTERAIKRLVLGG